MVEVGAGLSGLGTVLLTGDGAAGTAVVEGIKEQYGAALKTEGAEAIGEAVAPVFEKYEAGKEHLGELGMIQDSPGLATALYTAPDALMSVAGGFLGRGAINSTKNAGARGLDVSLVPDNVDSVAARRTYLNEKFGRTGDINYDITLRGYLEKVDSIDVSSRPGEAVFYSGWNPSGVSNRELGEAFARARGWTTLEQTPGGKWLDQQKLYGSGKQGDFFNPADADKVWAKLSQKYATGSEKSVTAFVNGAKPDRVFYQYEYPILKEKGVKINFID